MKHLNELKKIAERLNALIAEMSESTILSDLKAASTLAEVQQPRHLHGLSMTHYVLVRDVTIGKYELPAGTEFSICGDLISIEGNKTLAGPHEDPVLSVDADGRIPGLLDLKANTKFLFDDLKVYYSTSSQLLEGSCSAADRQSYLIGPTNEQDARVLVTLHAVRSFADGAPGPMQVEIDTKNIPEGYAALIAAIVETETIRKV